MVLKTADSPGIGEKRGMHGDGGHQPVLMGFLLATAHRVPGEIKRSRDLGRGRWSWTLSLAQKRSCVGRWSWAEKVGLPLFQLSKLFVNSGATDIVFVTLSKHSSRNSNCAVHKSLGNGEGTPP